MSNIPALILVLLTVVNLAAVWWVGSRPSAPDPDLLAKVDAARAAAEGARAELATLRQEADTRERATRAELSRTLESLRSSLAAESRQGRTESSQQFAAFQAASLKQIDSLNAAQKTELDRFAKRLELLSTTLNGNAEALSAVVQARFDESTAAASLTSDRLRAQVQERLENLQRSNDARLEAMQKTVDEKLQTVLESRLTESFKTVSNQLEQVHRGLGEMRDLATSVGDLKRVMTNVKSRGTWGEVLLGNLIEEVLPADRYEKNWAPPRRSERVEFAIKLPGGEDGKPVFLPVDAKFPKEDFERLQDAAERGDVVAVDTHRAALYARVISFARDIRDKYIVAPHTTDFAILFLPTEGLYAEILREPALADRLQREFRVVLAGPTTLLALLNSFQMGFRTLALQKKSAEIAQVLGAVKTEFGKFEEAIVAVRDRIRKAADDLDEKVSVRTRKITAKLRDIEALPDTDANRLFEASPTQDDEP